MLPKKEKIKKGIKALKKSVSRKTAGVGSGSYQSTLEQQVKAKAMYIASNGQISAEEISRTVGVSKVSLWKWKSKFEWDKELGMVSELVKQKALEAMISSPEAKELLYNLSKEEFEKVVQGLVGDSVEKQVQGFLTEVYRNDLQDLAKLNRMLRKHLDIPRDKPIHPQSLKWLIEAKVQLMDAIGGLFGKTPSKGQGIINSQSIFVEVNMGSEQQRALNEIIDVKPVDNAASTE